MPKNTVKYGLKNCHYAVATIDPDTHTATYATPVAWPGSISISLDPQGETTKFRADNIDYWIGQSNQGYEGDYENALVPDSFKKDVLGYIEDDHGVLVENAEAPTVHFALLFEFDGDAKATRHVLYNCTAGRPAIAGQTTEETIEPQGETSTITASSIYDAALGREIVKGNTKVDGDAATYAGWYQQVYKPIVSASE